MKNNKGITLIALIVTIIVLLILAAIGVIAVTNNNGIFTQADQAKKENAKGEIIEKLKIKVMDVSLNEVGNNNSKVTLDILKNTLAQDSEIQNLELIQGEAEGENYIIGTYNNYDFYIDNKLTITLGKLDLNFNSILEGQTITSDSLINAMSNTRITSGIYTLIINDQQYEAHIYVYDTNQAWDSMVFGDSSDVATAAAEAKRMVIVKVNGDLTINSGATITSFASASGYGGPKGMFIYATGNIINNGTITMTARGAKATGQNVYLWKNENASYEYIPAVGTNGAAGGYQSAGGTTNGATGASGTGRATGGRRFWTKKLWYRRSWTEKELHSLEEQVVEAGRI